MVDGILPDFLTEQPSPKSADEIAAEEHAARTARGKAEWAKLEAGENVVGEAFADACYYLDPVSNYRRRRRPR